MGHIRLGTLPRTRQWIQVLDLIGGGAGTPVVAAATMDASERGLISAAKDPGLVYTVWLLTQVPLAARSKDFVARLRKLGLEVSDSPSLLEVVGAFTGAVDAHLRRTGGRTDLGEMAQMAASEALAALGTPANASLFETTCCRRAADNQKFFHHQAVQHARQANSSRASQGNTSPISLAVNSLTTSVGMAVFPTSTGTRSSTRGWISTADRRLASSRNFLEAGSQRATSKEESRRRRRPRLSISR